MPSPRFAPLILAALSFAAAREAGAQIVRREATTTTPTLRVHTPTPVATSSYTPYSLGGALSGGGGIRLLLTKVSVSMTDGPVYLDRDPTSPAASSVVGVWSNPQTGVPDGVYSVAFTIGHASQPSVLTLESASGVSSQCTVNPPVSVSAPVSCELRDITVTGGKLDVSLKVTQGLQVLLTNVTVSRWQ